MGDDGSFSNDEDDVPLGTFLSRAFEDVDVDVDSVEEVRDLREDV